MHNILSVSVLLLCMSCSCPVPPEIRFLLLTLQGGSFLVAACDIRVDISSCFAEELRVFATYFIRMCCLWACDSACHMCLLPAAGCGHVALPHLPEMHVGEKDPASLLHSGRCMLCKSSKLPERDKSFISLQTNLITETLMNLMMNKTGGHNGVKIANINWGDLSGLGSSTGWKVKSIYLLPFFGCF